MNTKIELPKGFTARGANINDIESAMKLFSAWSQFTIQQDDITDADILRNEWVSPGFDPARDIRVVFSPEGLMVGYIEVWTNSTPPVHPRFWGRVHPEFGGLGIGTWLFQWAEEHACRVLGELPPEVRFAPRVGTYHAAKDSIKLFEDLGFIKIRSSYEMRIDMQDAPPAPSWSEGITLKVFDPQKDIQAVYEANKESFRDHFGYVEEPFETGFERFKHFMMTQDYDPSLWFLAMDGDEIAGICLCRPKSYNDPEMGYVNNLGVRRAWRKRGIGLALLLHSFGEFYRRGLRKAGLGVDAESLTGALRLYEKAGMQIEQAFDLFEKTVRSGREISVESILE